MPKETVEAKRRRALQVLDRLETQMPEAEIQLDYSTPLQLLVAVMLSAQCTDKRVNLVTPALFARYPDATALAKARTSELEGYIQSCGLFRSKARNIIAAAQALERDYRGSVPTSRQQLNDLPGVGRKTAGVVCIHLDGDEAFPVDTHILRLSKRLGFSTHAHPDKVEADLQKLLPSSRWKKGHQLLIWHGRRTCFARNPDCAGCVVNSLCPKIGVKTAKTKAASR